VVVHHFDSGTPGIHPSSKDGKFTDPYEMPYSGLLKASDGNLYGVAKFGGSPFSNAGYVFKVVPNKMGITPLAAFDSAKTSHPMFGLTEFQGKLYGVTRGNGSTDWGSVFRVGMQTGSPLEILHTFNGFNNDGKQPSTRLVVGNDGNLYGGTKFGGMNGRGTLFKVGKK
jgi:uncharacterized repeat protein (TIGR03803 family)